MAHTTEPSPRAFADIDAIVEVADTDKSDRKPVRKTNYQGVSLAMFPNTATRDDGTEFTLFNVVIECPYKGKDGEYHSTSNFSEEHFAIVEDFAREARQIVREQKTRVNCSRTADV